MFLSVVPACCALAGTATYQHASGLTFSYPDGWLLREDTEGLYLFPDGSETRREGSPGEYFYLGMSDASGITSANDPRVIGYFEQMIASDIPEGKRNGTIDLMDTGIGQAIVIPFTGSPRDIPSDILVYATVREEQGLFMIHFRSKTSTTNPSSGRKIFASLKLELTIDPDLTGSWVRTERSSSSAGSYDPSQFSTTHLVRYEFDGAGNVAMKSDFSSSSVSDDVSILTDDASILTGTYSTLGEELYIEWQDGREAEWVYSVFQDYNDGHWILKLEDPDTGKAKFYNLSN
ncbi:MAG TPA: hypothetical protein ENJ22_05115 [Gammaproteobacteria bacterium]|nr:hypothetical protein [Gammaproteobacteria bacterium]